MNELKKVFEIHAGNLVALRIVQATGFKVPAAIGLIAQDRYMLQETQHFFSIKFAQHIENRLPAASDLMMHRYTTQLNMRADARFYLDSTQTRLLAQE